MPVLKDESVANCPSRICGKSSVVNVETSTTVSAGNALGVIMTEVNPSEESTCAPVLATTVPLYCGFNKTPCADTFAKYFGFREPNNSYVKIGRVDDNLAYPPTC